MTSKNPQAGELSATLAPSKFDVRVHGSAKDDGQEAIEKVQQNNATTRCAATTFMSVAWEL